MKKDVVLRDTVLLALILTILGFGLMETWLFQHHTNFAICLHFGLILYLVVGWMYCQIDPLFADGHSPLGPVAWLPEFLFQLLFRLISKKPPNTPP